MSHLRSGTSWTTQDELAFLLGLGTYNVGSETTPRRLWLAGYVAALPLRQEWRSLDRAQITLAAAEAYAQEAA